MKFESRDALESRPTKELMMLVIQFFKIFRVYRELHTATSIYVDVEKYCLTALTTTFECDQRLLRTRLSEFHDLPKTKLSKNIMSTYKEESARCHLERILLNAQ